MKIEDLAAKLVLHAIYKTADNKAGYSGNTPPSVWTKALEGRQKNEVINSRIAHPEIMQNVSGVSPSMSHADFKKSKAYQSAGFLARKMFSDRASAARGIQQGLDQDVTYLDLLRHQKPKIYDRIAPQLGDVGVKETGSLARSEMPSWLRDLDRPGFRGRRSR